VRSSWLSLVRLVFSPSPFRKNPTTSIRMKKIRINWSFKSEMGYVCFLVDDIVCKKIYIYINEKEYFWVYIFGRHEC